MSVTLTDADYGRIMWAMREIASGYKTDPLGQQERLSREKMRATAGAVCTHFGWAFKRLDMLKPEHL